MSPPHAARLLAVRKAAFRQVASPPQRAFAVATAHAPPILVHRLFPFGFTLPVALPRLFLFRNVSTYFVTLHPLQDRADVVAFIGHQLFDSLDVVLGRILGTPLYLAAD